MVSPSSMSTEASVRDYESRTLEVADGFPRYTEWLMAELLPHLHGRVVEVGAGLGSISAQWVDQADEAILIEPAENLHEALAKRFADKSHVKTFAGLLDEVAASDAGKKLLAPGSVDTAVMVNVLEHIEDDVSVLRSLHRLLKPGGKMLIFVPALQVLYNALDKRVRHVRRYDKRGLSKALIDAGFEIERMRYFDLLGIGPWFVTGTLLRRETVGDGSGRFYDRFVVPLCRLADGRNGRVVGKNLIAIGHKAR